MQNHKQQRLVGLLTAIVVLTSPLLAQQRRSAPKRPGVAEASEPAPTFDSLLAAESYKVYCEVRAVGGLVRSPAVTDLLDPLIKLGKPPQEFETLVKWLNAHADILAGSRMMVAGWPSRPKLPNVLVAIEFSSPEEAKKFYPELRDFLPKLLPTPTPTPALAPPPAAKPVPVIPGATIETRVVARAPVTVQLVPEPQPTPAPPPYQMQQAGSLVLISDTAFTLRSLRPRGSKALEEDQNFMLARNRFASESIFLYVDLKSIEKEEKAQQQKYEEEEQKRIEAEAANPPKVEETVDARTEVTTPPPSEEEMPSATLEPPVVYTEPTPDGPPSEGPASGVGTLSGAPQTGTDEVGPMMFSLYGALFGGESKWPEAVGVALVFENDAYVIRTLIVNSVENKGNAIPFVPQFVSGPAIVPESPNIFPADTDLFVSASVDYPQMYEGMLKAMVNAEALSRKNSREPVKEGPPPETPFAVYEKKLGIKIKDDLLPLLGNEIALGMSKKATKALKEVPEFRGEANPATGDATPKNAKPVDPTPVFAISVKDREAVGRLIPKLIEGFGLKGANLFAQTEKRDGTEITTYGSVFSYAFVGDFLVVSPDAAETRHVVDAYLSHQTLSSDNHFRNFTRWQPRQVLGQVYVGPDLVETYNPFGIVMGRVDTKMNDFLSRLSPLIEPTTYALSNDGSGPLHELHIPRNLLMWLVGAAFAGAESATTQLEERAGQSLLRTVYSAEETFRATQGNDHYGTLDELVAADLISKDAIQKEGYRIEVTVSGNKFEAIALPIGYGVTGTLSYFIDESGVLRAGDHGGDAATVADQPVE